MDKPGKVVATISKYFPESLHSPFLYIISLTVVCIVLRLSYLLLNVWQTKKFVSIAKDIIYRIRYQLLDRLKSVAMSEYETLGGGAVSSKFVTDLNTVDQFAGETVSKFLVAGVNNNGCCRYFVLAALAARVIYYVYKSFSYLYHYADW